MNDPASEATSLRLFVAVELPPAWLDALAAAQASLRRQIETPGGRRLRWVRPEAIHLTLKFLGEVASQRLPAIEDALTAAVPAAPDLTLSLDTLGFFAGGRRVRVIWAGIGGDLAGLASLAERIDAACTVLGFAPERRPFAPHLTLARVPENISLSADELAPCLQATAISAAPLRVERVSLIRSQIGPGGARYERLAARPA